MASRNIQGIRSIARHVSRGKCPACPTASLSSVRWSSTSPQEPHPQDDPPQTRQARRKPKPKKGIDKIFEVAREDSRHRVQYNPDHFSTEPTEEHYNLPLVTAQDLAASSTRPKSVRMLARDFIHDSLYNPAYGYFSRHAVLLPDTANPANGVNNQWDFSDFRSEKAFAAAVQARYQEFEDAVVRKQTEDDDKHTHKKLRPKSAPYHTEKGYEQAQAEGRAAYNKSLQQAQEHDEDVQSMVAQQVWHTPTEIFKPHYANIIAQHCVDSRPNDDRPLVIYELGAGSGSLAEAVLSYLEAQFPEIYQTVQYNIVEISQRLSTQQRQRLKAFESAGRLKIHNSDFLKWNRRVEDDCVVIALEVLDNFTHDVVRYSTADLKPYQTYVSIDSTGDMQELYVPATDPLILRYLDMYHTARPESKRIPPTGPNYLRYIPESLRPSFTENFPLYPNMTPPHYIPTGCLEFLDVLEKYFPRHRLVVSDFHSLPNSLVGVNAPVVQTRFQGTMIPVTKYTVLQGFFDIFFPTDFNLLRDMHGRNGKVYSHSEFLQRYPALSNKCKLKDGSNPMLSWYGNASWLVT